MAFPEHYLLQYGGTLYQGQDIWTNNIRFTTGLLDIEGALDDLVTDISNHMQTANSGYSSRTQLEFVKLNKINSLGAYDDPTATHVRELTTPVQGATSSVYPPQVSLCVTLLTDNARGYASKGRVYIPVPSHGIGSDGKMSSAFAALTATAWAQFMANLGNTPGLDAGNFNPAVVSQVPAGGAINEVTAVQVGTVMDTQQRRRNAFVEVYSKAAVP